MLVRVGSSRFVRELEGVEGVHPVYFRVAFSEYRKTDAPAHAAFDRHWDVAHVYRETKHQQAIRDLVIRGGLLTWADVIETDREVARIRVQAP